MFDFTDTITAAPSKAFQELRSFAGENADTLACAAALLGASPGVRNALSALDGLANQAARPHARCARSTIWSTFSRSRTCMNHIG